MFFLPTNQTDTMTDDGNHESDNPAGESLRERLRAEAGLIEWSELVRHFARGVLISVDSSLDILAVAETVARDDTEALQLWLDQSLVRRATDDDARDWTAREPRFVCVVTAPWVLVQEADQSGSVH